MRKQVQYEPPKAPPNNTASIIQQARLRGIYYKCKEIWFPGHKKVCKMSNQTQIQALQEQYPDEADLVYFTEISEESEQHTEHDQQQLQLSMHALMGISTTKHSFTVTVMLGQHPVTALIGSGSSATFISPDLATRAGCSLTPTKKTKGFSGKWRNPVD